MFIFVELARLTADPVLRETATGKTVCTFTVAADTGKRDDAGEKITNFLSVTAWNKEAERVQKYLKKGDPISVVGQFFLRNYKTSKGEARSSMDVDATKITFLPNPNRSSSRDDEKDEVSAPRRRRATPQATHAQRNEDYEVSRDEDEMPF